MHEEGRHEEIRKRRPGPRKVALPAVFPWPDIDLPSERPPESATRRFFKWVLQKRLTLAVVGLFFFCASAALIFLLRLFPGSLDHQSLIETDTRDASAKAHYAAIADSTGPLTPRTRAEVIWERAPGEPPMPSKEEMRRWILDPENRLKIREAVDKDPVLHWLLAFANKAPSDCCENDQQRTLLLPEEGLQALVEERYLTEEDRAILKSLENSARR